MPPCPKCLEYNFESPLEVWEQDPDGLCLFHSPRPDKDQNGAFTAFLEKKKSTEDFNFTGFIFPNDVIFKKYKFNKDVSFVKVIFLIKPILWELNFVVKFLLVFVNFMGQHLSWKQNLKMMLSSFLNFQKKSTLILQYLTKLHSF